MHELLRRAKAEGTPLIDGDQATFVWRGKTAPQLMGDFNAWGEWGRALTDLDAVAPGVWAHTRAFEPDAYIEYGFARVVKGNIDYFHPLPDPFNPRSVSNGIGGRNSILLMPQARMTPLVKPPRHADRGSVTRIQISAPGNLIGHTRTAWMYRPAHAYVKAPYPLLLVLDGKDFARRAKLPAILDNLIAQGRIQPVGALMLDNAGAGRAVEYHCSDAFIEAIQKSIVPQVGQHLNLANEAGAHGVLGASSGGLAALWIGLRLPNLFGKVYALAGPFEMPTRAGPAMTPVTTTLVEKKISPQLQIELACGTHDFLIDGNRRFHAVLRRRGYKARLRTYSAGHNYAAWGNDLEHGLIALFGR